MMRTRLIFSTLFALMLLLALALPVAAQDGGPGKLVVGGSYTLRSGQRLVGDLAVLGGQATIQKGATVDGDIFVAGGAVDIAGRVNGDVAIFGGSVNLASSAYVDGDLVAFGGSVQQDEGAVVTGETRRGGEFEWPGWRGMPFVPGIVTPEGFRGVNVQRTPGEWVLVLFLRFIRAMAMTLALAALALVVALFWPKGVERIGQTALEQPILAFAVGLLTWVLGFAAVVISAITICLIPVAVLLSMLLVVAGLLAWIAAGWIVGHKLMSTLNLRNPTVVVEATVGTLLLALIYFLVGLLPCVDFIFGMAVASFGLGAIVLTRFGTRPYVAGAPGAAPGGPADATSVAVTTTAAPTSVPSTAQSAASRSSSDVVTIEDPSSTVEKDPR